MSRLECVNDSLRHVHQQIQWEVVLQLLQHLFLHMAQFIAH